MGSRRNRAPLALIFLCSLAAVGMIVAAAATADWTNAVAYRQNFTNFTDQEPDVPDENGNIPDFTGYIQFGLFNGQKVFNKGFSSSQSDAVPFSIFKEHQEIYSMAYPIVVFVLLFIAAVFAFVSTIFGLVNAVTVPIETIHGPMGLYLWNGIGAGASLAAWVLYLVLYLTQLIKNVLAQEDIDPNNYFETHAVSLGYSYWLVVASCSLFLLNLILVLLARLLRDPDFLRHKKREMDIAHGVNNLGLDDIMY